MPLNYAKMLQGMEHSVIVDCGGDVVGMGLDFVEGIAHCHSNA